MFIVLDYITVIRCPDHAQIENYIMYNDDNNK